MKKKQLVYALSGAHDDSYVFVNTPDSDGYQIERVEITVEVQGNELVRTVTIKVV